MIFLIVYPKLHQIGPKFIFSRKDKYNRIIQSIILTTFPYTQYSYGKDNKGFHNKNGTNYNI